MAPDGTRPARFAGHVYPQTLPEPDDIREGAAAPWSHLAIEQRTNISLTHVARRLRDAANFDGTLIVSGEPSVMAQVGDADPQEITRRSAVLVALFEEEGETRVVLTRRSSTLREHRGEVSFPGGRSDEGETPVQTALRETHEEVGIEPSAVEVVATLSPLITFAFQSSIFPVVGFLERAPVMVTDPAEVEVAFSVALRDLLADGAFLEERWQRSARPFPSDAEGYFPIYLYRLPEDLLWGATARVVTELLCIVTGVHWPEASGPGPKFA
jgi:8-oxo-dGTP pyrophosphatase MutT (NUDIX family)